MAQRKSKSAKEEAEKILAQLQKVENLRKLAEEEELETLKNAHSKIKTICEKDDMFCGVILNHTDLIGILQVALETGDKTIRIGFNLYYNE